MTMLPFRGRCHTCGHDHDAEDTRLRDVLESTKQPHKAILPGWVIERFDNPPFKWIEVTAPTGASARAFDHGRNPENILYMLLDCVLQLRESTK